MDSSFYLPRTLFSDEKTYSEAELPNISSHIIVLAEPGGGKTELLNSLAKRLGTHTITANQFVFFDESEENAPLVIDAFDELAKLDQTGIYRVLAKVKKAKPKQLIISSRSSEWGDASTHSFKQALNTQPLILRLREFDQAEQCEIFAHHTANEDFAKFRDEVARFDLDVLLPNPQFLKLFADAYIESGRHFFDKRSIFTKAMERLAKEANPAVETPRFRLSTEKKVELASEVFAKLLLSGAEGVCTSEASESRIYPWLVSLMGSDAAVDGILATQLFKPGDSPNLHNPVHKIVAEYCAADYLCKKISSPNKVSQCLAIIAPNKVVRDDLRGLLGWMAALGDSVLQEQAIKLDPYAVLANGDPSQLAPSSKRLLIHQLKEIEAQDPYFRRGDAWRSFSVAGFFTDDVVAEIKSILNKPSDGHLRDLMLELLAGVPVIAQLAHELQLLALTSTESEYTRRLANQRLLEIASHDHQADLKVLIEQGGETALELAATTINALGAATLLCTDLIDFFKACTLLYPAHNMYESTIGARYFIKQMIAGFDLETIEWLLDDLTKDLACHCGKQAYECDCRNGISKIVGSMLDQYFTLAVPPFEPVRVWRWIGNLNFHEQRSPKECRAVQVLRENTALRQGIIAHVFGGMTDRQQIFKTKFEWNGGHSRSGLYFHTGDLRFVVDLAFEADNLDLWASFMATHQYYRKKEERGPDSLRQHMRKQALEKPLFAQQWVTQNRAAAESVRADRSIIVKCIRKARRREMRGQKEVADTLKKNFKCIQENRKLIESGKRWDFLVRFAELVLEAPAKIELEIGDKSLVQNTLRNCLGFIAASVPELCELAESQCTPKYLEIKKILYAACLEVFRNSGNLEGVDSKLLKALRTSFDVSGSGVPKNEREALKKELHRLIFPDDKSAEDFLRQYIEPQLAQPRFLDTELETLQREEIFSHLRASLSIEWLWRFPDLALPSMGRLFLIAAQYADREALNKIIAERCAQLMTDYPTSTGDVGNEEKRKFWLLRAWYFLPDTPKVYWDWLKAGEDTIFTLDRISGSFSHGDYPSWPKLSPNKVEAVLQAFIGQWPKLDLPNFYGPSSPPKERAYRFLTEIMWSIESADANDAMHVLDRLLADPRFTDMHKGMKSIRAALLRKNSLQNFTPPTPKEIVALLDQNQVVTVEGLRQRVIEELQALQKDIFGSEFNPQNHFYEKGERLGEVRCTEIIAERLNLILKPQNIVVTPEHQLKDAKRSDFTVAKTIQGKRCLLVTEVKGQWNKELYTAAAAQLYERYAIHPDAAQQGVYLVIWFGTDEIVAGQKKHDIANAEALKSSIEAKLPSELKGRIDVFVLDVARRG